MSQFSPKEDGVTHINVYSRGQTQLGQLLSNFAHTPFKHPRFGFFASMEGFWYWVSCGGPTGERSVEPLRRLYGASAKSVGRKLLKTEIDPELFKQYIREGLRAKVEQSPQILDLLKLSALPFTHYFVYGSDNDVVVNKPEHDWQMKYLEALRRVARGELDAAVLDAGGRVFLSDGSIKDAWDLTAQDEVVVTENGETILVPEGHDGTVVWGPKTELSPDSTLQPTAQQLAARALADKIAGKLDKVLKDDPSKSR